MFGSSSPSLCPAEDKNADNFFSSFLVPPELRTGRRKKQVGFCHLADTVPFMHVEQFSGSSCSSTKFKAPCAETKSNFVREENAGMQGESIYQCSTFLACSPARLGPPPAPLWPQTFICLLSTGILLISSCGIKLIFGLFVCQSRQGSCSWLAVSSFPTPPHFICNTATEINSYNKPRIPGLPNFTGHLLTLTRHLDGIKFSTHKGMTETLQVTCMCHIQHLSEGLVKCCKQDHSLCLYSLALLQLS